MVYINYTLHTSEANHAGKLEFPQTKNRLF